MSEPRADEPDDVDPAYRAWLAARRSENQQTALRLHFLIRAHAVRISESKSLVDATRGLVGAASSLWRAACLSDRIAVYEDFEEDDFFLTDRIIQDEFVGDPSPRPSPDWSFFSYMSNARRALTTIASATELSLVMRTDIPVWVGLSYKECWVRHQTVLDVAVARFEEALSRQYADV